MHPIVISVLLITSNLGMYKEQKWQLKEILMRGQYKGRSSFKLILTAAPLFPDESYKN